mgnify:FL=1
MKKKVKIFSIIMLIIITLSSFIGTFTYAQEVIDPNKYNPGNTGTAPAEMTNVINAIITVIQTIGIILSVIVIGILGVKYMTGSVEERADYKKSLIPYLIGTVLLTTVATVVRIINDLTTQAIG